MAAYRGNQLVLAIGDGASPEVFTTIGGIRTPSVTLNGNPIDVTTADDVDGAGIIWRTNISGVRDFSVSGEYISKSENAAQSKALVAAFNDGTADNYKITLPGVGSYVCAMLVTEISPTGPYDNVTSYNITLTAADVPTYTEAA